MPTLHPGKCPSRCLCCTWYTEPSHSSAICGRCPDGRSPLSPRPPALLERCDEAGECVGDRALAVEPRSPVLDDLVAAPGAAHPFEEFRVCECRVVDAARFELARGQLAGGVEQHCV